jgi:outer membrane receptor protein involved in Fe transport
VVLRPDFIPGLQIAVDWYDIRLRNAISTPPANTVAELCVDQPSLDNAFCAAIDRDRGTGYISGFRVQPQNVAEFATAGLELNAVYRTRIGADATLDLRLIGGYLDKLTQIATPGADVEDNADQAFRPRYSLTFSPTLTSGPVTLAYNLRWQDGTRRFAKRDTDDNPRFVDPRYFRTKELWQHDVQVDFAATDRFSYYLGVNNLGDQKPDIGFATNVPISPLGRFFYAGARVNFGR